MTAVRIVMQKSRSPANVRYPTAPAYGPRAVGSCSAISSIARRFGAPVTVPAGNVTANASSGWSSSRSSPSTVDTMCITLVNRSTSISSVGWTEPGDAYPSEIVAGEVHEHRVLGLLLRVGEQLVLEEPVSDLGLPRGRVPAIGRADTRRPSTRTSGSGDDPASSIPSIRRKNMYGAGFVTRSRR